VFIPEYITAPLEKGEVVGRIDFFVDEKIISSLPIKVAESVKKLGYTDVLRRFVNFVTLG